MRRGGYALVVGALVVAACSSSESADESTSTLAPTTTAVTTTTASTTTTAPTTSTSTTTTVAPTTTASEEQILADVEAAYFAAREAYLAAAQDPANEELRQGIADTYTGANLELTTNQLDDFAESGTYAEVDPDDAPFAVNLEGPVRLESDPPLADLVVCEVNSERYLQSSTDGADEIVVRGDPVIVRVLVRMELVDDLWKSQSGEILARLSSADECVP